MHALVVAALVSPAPIEERVYQMEVEAALPAQRDYWLAMGVIEECEYHFKIASRFKSDLRECLDRLADTPPDAPPFEAALGLPQTGLAYRNYLEGQNYIRHLNSDVRDWLVQGEETAILDAVIADTQKRSDIWHLIYRCSGNYSGVVGRRFEMHRLREMVGREAFERGEWPDPLPPCAHLWDWRETSPYEG